MTRYGMVIDINRCNGCYNCQIACKDEHCGYDYPGYAAPQPMTGHFWMKLVERERGRYPRVKVSCTPILCQHCAEAPCLEKAENGAVYRRPDGIVIIDPEKARGQKQLVEACPHGVIYWNEELQLPQKCTFCAHLLDEGWKEPRCVEICPAGALRFGDMDDPDSEVARLVASGGTGPLDPGRGGDGSVRYIGLPGTFIAGTVIYADTDECAEGVAVTLNGSGSTVTSAFGDFEFEGLDDNTEHEVKIEAEGYKTIRRSVKTKGDIDLGTLPLERESP